MSFIGGIVTGILGNDDLSDGFINGGFFSLILLINLGFVVGIKWIIIIAVSSYLSSALQTYTGGLISTPNVVNNTSQSKPVESFLSIIQYIIVLIITFFGGVLGGGLGAYIKKSFK